MLRCTASQRGRCQTRTSVGALGTSPSLQASPTLGPWSAAVFGNLPRFRNLGSLGRPFGPVQLGAPYVLGACSLAASIGQGRAFLVFWCGAYGEECLLRCGMGVEGFAIVVALSVA